MTERPQPHDQLGEHTLHPTDRADVVGDDRHLAGWSRWGAHLLILGRSRIERRR
jgi:hypothetical protein